MPKIIEAADVTEYETHKFCTEASDIGLKPGEWPDYMKTTMGNKMDFQRALPEIHFGEVAAVMYFQVGGCISLKVFND